MSKYIKTKNQAIKQKTLNKIQNIKNKKKKKKNLINTYMFAKYNELLMKIIL